MFSKKLEYYDYAVISIAGKTDVYPYSGDVRASFSQCEKLVENESYTIFKNVGVDCLPEDLKPTGRE